MTQPVAPPARRTTRRWFAAAAVIALVAAGAYLRHALQLQWDTDAIRTLVRDLGFWGPLAFVLLITFRLVFLIPSPVILVAAGACFGLAKGTLYGALGVTLSALLAFSLTRGLRSERLTSQVPPRLRELLALAGRRGGAIVVTAGTGSPIGPMTAVHVAAGLTSMPYTLFLVAASIGATVRAVLFVFVGSRLAERGLAGVWPALVPLALVLLPLLHGPTRARILHWVRA